MARYLRLSYLYLVLLAIVTLGRWYLGNVAHVPYANATDKLSIVIMTLFASIFYGAFCRRWQGFGVLQALILAALLGFMSQIVVFSSTALSYALGIDSYFTFPRALNSEGPLSMGAALGVRAGGMLGNTVGNAIAGMIGWLLGGLLPQDR
ncbi:MAG: hypothetical protein ACHQNV_04215 [Vicinamibacteria bacterium]